MNLLLRTGLKSMSFVEISFSSFSFAAGKSFLNFSTGGRPRDWGVSRRRFIMKNPARMQRTPGTYIEKRQPHVWAQKAAMKGMRAPPTLWDVLVIPHHVPLSFWEYQWVRSRAQGGQPHPWNTPLSPQKIAKKTIDEVIPKQMLNTP